MVKSSAVGLTDHVVGGGAVGDGGGGGVGDGGGGGVGDGGGGAVGDGGGGGVGDCGDGVGVVPTTAKVMATCTVPPFEATVRVVL